MTAPLGLAERMVIGLVAVPLIEDETAILRLYVPSIATSVSPADNWEIA